ncbi:SRPBCC domain-containing protein [Arthrobacter sp. zg-Y820]|uniref:SRPBCC domain-containing protein n=1 Tax=unclassified Arthrobacter TaxID=235627 RepID=UPI001E494125|nr:MULTISPECIES: SRPBCC domain-containing protein [unclassified Arthrobacter]MCC9198238.1 SRPBCC domain-containing protein [Arthrobacter sp. zg-Y820]MDK1281107.1 SRPBCC domain-containing protein [Arthrobacter sp. zg.Y820]MDK1360425.1 SRPBCC domain-containing protein [Arthrobacter sp. zg-Y1219]WIB10565.1 SRPBCC domain-containing protein [Arthrobacter sp. zg-Y820]
MSEQSGPAVPEGQAVPEGRIQKLTDGYAVAFDRQFDYPTAHIWDVLTNSEKVSRWLGDVTPQWRLGKEYTLEMDGGTSTGTVLQLEPRSSLQLTWEDQLGLESVLEWQVLESGGGALLQFRSRTDSPDFLTEGSAGWQGILNSFASVAAGREPDPDSMDRWLALRDAYASEFDISPTMGRVTGEGADAELVFERWYRAPAEDVEAAVETAGRTLSIGGDAQLVMTDDGHETKATIREPVTGSQDQTATLLAAWHAALDAVRDQLDGQTPNPNLHRRAALERFYRAML